MDAQYTIKVTNKYLADAAMAAKVAAVDISTVEEERGDDFAVHTDNTVIFAAGEIRRIIVATLTEDFESRFPSNDDRRYALEGAFESFFNFNIPASVTESLSLI